MEKKYVVTMLCTDTDNTYYNDIIEQEFETRESAMECIDKCIKEDGVFINGEKIFPSDCFGSEEIGCAICNWINENIDNKR